jgi:hypothetical protein
MRAVPLLLGVVAFTSALEAQGPATVSGTVRDETGAPVREALVVIDPDSLSLRTRTGVDGRYRIPDVPSGRYEVRVVRIGYRPQSRTIDVARRELDVDFELRSVAIPLDTVAVRATRPGLHGLVITRGIAIMPGPTRTVRGARVEVLNDPHNASSGTDGRFSMPDLASGSYTVLVSFNGFATRMVPVTVPADGGIEITVTLDSLYAEYQRKDEDQLRGVSWRSRRATSPAAVVSPHELDPDLNLREGLKYSESLLSRGVRLGGACIYLNGQPRTELNLEDFTPEGIESVEVYPAGTLQDQDRLPSFPRMTPCELLWSNTPAAIDYRRGRVGQTRMRNRGNRFNVVVIWTRSRR